MKTISIKEAFEKATQGPLQVGRGGRIEQKGKHGNGRIIADTTHDPHEGDNGETRKYDAAILAHCFNHFQNLLEAIYDIQGYAFCDCKHPACKRCKATKYCGDIVAKATKVQIP